MSGVELALAVVPLVIALIQHRKPLLKAGKAILSSTKNYGRDERSDFYSQLYIELSMLHNTLQRLAGNETSEDPKDRHKHLCLMLGTGIQLFEDILKNILQSLDDLVSDRSLGLEGMNLERTMLARLEFIKRAASNSDPQGFWERFRFTKNEKSQKIAMKRIQGGNDRLFLLIRTMVVGLDGQENRVAGKLGTPARSMPTARSWRLMDPLYKKLAKNWPKGCCNQFEHMAKLSLSTHRSPKEPSSNEGINIVISLQGDSAHPNWQEMSVVTPQEKLVRFASDDETQQTPPASPRVDIDSESLCSLLRQAHDNGTDLRVALESDKLWQLRPKLATCRFRRQTGTPLKTFLPNGAHTWKLRERSVLAVILAHTVLHCLGSPWLGKNWSKDHVVFFRKESSAEIEFDHPFLTIDFDDQNETPEQSSPLSVHSNPTILALGILLLEIYTQTAIESRRSEEHLTGGMPNPNTDLTTAMNILKEWEGDLRVKYRQAVRECLYWDDVPLNGDDLRQKIYEKVVVPLERELAEGFPEKESMCGICEQYSSDEGGDKVDN